MDGGKIEASDFYECGVMAAYAGDYEGAIASFYQACAIMPCWPAARAGLCLAYHEAGRSDEMLAAFEELPTHESADAERLFVMAVALDKVTPRQRPRPLRLRKNPAGLAALRRRRPRPRARPRARPDIPSRAVSTVVDLLLPVVGRGRKGFADNSGGKTPAPTAF
jgi:hypothetical protein